MIKLRRVFQGVLVLTLFSVGCGGESTDSDGGAAMNDGGTPPVTDGSRPTPDGSPPSGDDGSTPLLDAGAEDAGPPGPVDAGPNPPCDMGRIRIQDECGEFTACGGDPVGSWCYSDVCITVDELVDQVFALSPVALPQDCLDARDEITIDDVSGSIDGTVTITDSTITRDVTNFTAGTFFIPIACALGNCSVLEGVVDSLDEATAICTEVDDASGAAIGCSCALTFTSSISEGPLSYSTTDDNALLFSSRRFEYCVEGGDLAMRDVGDDAIEPGIQSLKPDGD